MKWMNLEPIIQSGMSQKEKDKHRILTHIYRIQKNGTEEFIYRTAVEKLTQRIDLWTWGRGGEGEVYGKSNMQTYITICKIDRQQEFAVWAQETHRGFVSAQRGGMGGRLEGGSKGRGYMYTYG